MGGNVFVKNVHLSTDSVLYAETRKDSTKRKPVKIDIFIPLLEVTGVSTPQALLSKQIRGHAIRIHSSTFNLAIPEKTAATDSQPAPDLPRLIYEQVLSKIQDIRIDSLQLDDIDFTLRDAGTGKAKFHLGGLSVALTGILIDSTHLEDSNRIFFGENIRIRCKDFGLNSGGKQYKYGFRDIDYNSATASLHLGSVSLTPLLSEEAFNRALRFSNDRFHFEFGQINLDGIDRRALFHQRVIARTVRIGSADLKIYRDLSKPHDSVDRTEKFPQDAIAALKVPIYLGEIIFSSANIEYKEKNPKSGKSGSVLFARVKANLRNVSNIPEKVKLNNHMILGFSSLFLNKAQFNTTINFVLGDPAGKFSLHARMGPMNGPDLNPLIMPMGLAKIERGKINGLVYDMQADHRAAKGRLTFLYQDIKVSLLKKDDSDTGFKKRFLPSLAAGLLVKDSNPAHGETRHADIDFTRDRNRSIFHLMWKSMFSGIKEIAGMKK